MKRWMVCVLVFVQVLPSFGFADQKGDGAGVGVLRLSLFDQSREREVPASFFYPVSDKESTSLNGGIWEGVQLAEGAPMLAVNGKKMPLIVVSHGYKGSIESLHWLVEGLVKRGFLVAAVKHFDGADSSPYMEHWHRALDVSFLLNVLFKDKEFSSRIDPEKVGFAGYSLGTAAGLWLAGGIASTYERTANPGRQFVPELEFPEVGSQVYNDLLTHTDIASAKKSYLDPRIKAVFLLAPGYGWAFDAEGLSRIKIPVFIVAAERDEMLYPETNAYYFSKFITDSRMKILPEVGHFVFLQQLSDRGDPEKKARVESLGSYRYSEKERREAHRMVEELASQFFLSAFAFSKN